MKSLFIVVLAYLPTAALADFECQIDQQCGMGQCEGFQGEPFVVHEAGDTWQITAGGTVYEGYVSTTIEGSGEINIVVPPQNGTSALVSIYDSGAAVFTFHALNGSEPVSIAGYGNCAGDGG